MTDLQDAARQPAWLDRAWADLGQREVAGNRDNPRIVTYFADVGFPDVRHDEVAWCAAFAGACLERAGIASTRLLLARSYLGWGQALSKPRLGAIVVLSRGSDPALGHVGFWVGETATHVFLLGGNQGDAVAVEGYDKSRLLGLRWPAGDAPDAASGGGGNADDAAGGVAARPTTAAGKQADLFEVALAHVLLMEGGWSNDPYDPGGPTQSGITLATYAAWRGERLDAASSSRLEAELRAIPVNAVRAIYAERYWTPSRADRFPPALALMHFDAAVNHGVNGAARMLQEALGVAIDGEIGPQTLAAASRSDPAKVIAGYAEIRRRKYRRLSHFWRFGRGWLSRVDATLKAAGRLPAIVESNPPAMMKGAKAMSQISSDDDRNTGDVGDGIGKWWGESMTIWGVAITTLSTVLPVVGPLFGLDISADVVRQLGAQATNVIQAVAALFGTLLTVYGRSRAAQPLVRREMRVRL
jgi:uncharacterized protein (TIGR02594 family)